MENIREFKKEHCIRTMYDESVKTNKDLIAIYKLEKLSDRYKENDYQLIRLTGGFGCSPSSSGNACYGTFCIDGESTRLEKYDFIGIANKEVTQYAEELEKRRDL